MIYKEVFQLAQDKGYKFHFEWDHPYKRTYKNLDDWKAIDQEIITSNPLFVLAELTLIQKWLRDEHYTYVEITLDSYRQPYQLTPSVRIMDEERQYVHYDRYFTKYPATDFLEASIEGTYQALKLLP